MKREYQNREAVNAVQVAAERAVQISLPMAEVLTSPEQGLGELVRKVGRMFIESVLESEVEQVAGPRSWRRQTRQAYRWGVEQGSCMIDGSEFLSRASGCVRVVAKSCHWARTSCFSVSRRPKKRCGATSCAGSARGTTN